MMMATNVQTKRRSDDVEVTPELRDTAWHEAGHAVAALVLGRAVIEVTIVPSNGRCGPRLGHCRHHPHFFNHFLRSQPPLGPGDRERIEEEIIISFAGPVASWAKARIPKGMPRWGRHDDWANAYRCADHLARTFCVPYSRAETHQYLLWLYRRATALLAHEPHSEAVRSVTRALIANRTLDKEATLAAYNAGLDEWTRDAQRQVCDYNDWHSPHIPHENLSPEQLLELLPLITAAKSRRWALMGCSRTMVSTASKALHKAESALDRHLKTLGLRRH
jgi:hypothetical protein